MAEKHSGTAVGAGSEAGDAEDQEQDTTSRAAEAVEDAGLESIRTTGAAPKGTAGNPAGVGDNVGSALVPPAPGAQPTGEGGAQHHYSDRPRKDLEQNEAGIGSRLDERSSERRKAT